MERALHEAFGIAEISGDIPAAGRTDRAITHDLLREHGIEPTSEARQRFQAAYFRHLPQVLATLDGTVLPGIRQLLEVLSQRPDVELGLLTGNFREAAWMKLSQYRLDSHFAFGGFGDEHHDRDDVARVAWAETERHLARTPDPQRVWVIGDTPSDVKCGRAIGAKVVAVATGIFTRQELAPCAADLLVDDFSDPELFLRELR